MSERWLSVAGYEGLYEVSDAGRVRSIARNAPRVDGRRHPVPARVLKANPNSNGYLCVALHSGGVQRTKRVSQLVAAAFIGPRPTGLLVCHDDGDYRNDRAGNLRYDTSKANSEDMVRHGRSQKGELAPSAKLTAEQVRAIRADARSQRLIAIDYGVDQANISAIKRGKTWRHVTGAVA